ncbi:MAG: MraY family glycosyltransferase [Luteimonas sp.]
MILPIDLHALSIFLAALAAGLLTCLVQWLLHPVAHRLNLLDHPSGRKDHSQATPVTGGLAMALGALLVTYFVSDTATRVLYGFMLGSGLLIGVGVLDDKYDLPWWLRIGVQVLAALSMIYLGGVQIQHLGPLFGFGDAALGRFAVPFTVFATVGLINTINMIDGADGLAGSLVAAALTMLAAAALYAGNDGLALLIGVLDGAVLGFLAYNMRLPWRPRARLFMGNAGSTFLGYAIAWAAFRLTQNPFHDVSPILALWVLPVPVMDTLVVMLRRVVLHKSPFHADRNHIHHLMLDAGFGPTRTALFLALFSGVTGLACGIALRADVPEPLLLGTYLALCAFWYWLTSPRERAIGFFRRFRTLGLAPR